MFELKTLSPEAVPRALAKAERYRLLNEPGEAQSICLDVLAADPDNQEAVRTIILALTDQFGTDISCVSDALTTVADLKDHYERAYYTGIVHERRAKAHLAHGTPRAGARAYEWLREAMRRYEEADAIRPPNNDDARLRWNACARLIASKREIAPVVDDPHEPLLSE
jgi:hypothetical protein